MRYLQYRLDHQITESKGGMFFCPWIQLVAQGDETDSVDPLVSGDVCHDDPCMCMS